MNYLIGFRGVFAAGLYTLKATMVATQRYLVCSQGNPLNRIWRLMGNYKSRRLKPHFLSDTLNSIEMSRGFLIYGN